MEFQVKRKKITASFYKESCVINNTYFSVIFPLDKMIYILMTYKLTDQGKFPLHAK